MTALRWVVAVLLAVVVTAAVGFNLPPVRERLADPVTRLFVLAFVDFWQTRGTWREGRSAPTPKMEAPSAALNGKLYVFGGFAGTTYGAPVEPMVSVYDPAIDQWSRAADLPLPVTHCNTVLVDGKVWLAGGYRGAHPGGTVADVLRYDVAADRW